MIEDIGHPFGVRWAMDLCGIPSGVRMVEVEPAGDAPDD